MKKKSFKNNQGLTQDAETAIFQFLNMQMSLQIFKNRGISVTKSVAYGTNNSVSQIKYHIDQMCLTCCFSTN